MRKQFRLFPCTRLVAAFVLLAMGTGVAAQGHGDHANMVMDVAAPAAMTRTVNWSDASAWPSGKVPAAGEAVTIPRGTEVTLDVSPPELRSLTVLGKLTFADERDLALTTDWIYVPGGELQIGTEASPFQHNATITLTDTVQGE
ncbi:MAG: G8 domain-containing protein, partial [Croceibacterium sp.]